MPASWKSAIVILIPKHQKDHTQPENHRPISLLCVLSKLLERVFLVRFLHWVESNNIISQKQSGFRKGRQTKDHIVRLLQDGATAFNSNKKLAGLFIDIKQAFDKVWHNGLLFKLNNYNIPNHLGKWIQNYLDGRSFQVRSNNAVSSTKQIHTGVPQGSVLGPLLFIVFFNDIADTVKQIADLELGIYADDVAIWLAAINTKTIEKRLQSALDELFLWANNWRTTLSETKTTFTIFNKHGTHLDKAISLFYGQHKLNSEPNPKFLGVTLDPALRLHVHAKVVQERCQKRLNILRCIKGKTWGVSSSLLLIVYKVLIRSIIDYAPMATISMCPTYQLALERVQNAAIRHIIYWPPTVNTATMLKQLKLDSITDRALILTNNYLQKARTHNPIIDDLIKSYNYLTA